MEVTEISSSKAVELNKEATQREATTVDHFVRPRICLGACGALIPEARLKVKPNATMCVPCLTAAGDVPVLRRFDQETENGTVEAFFTRDTSTLSKVNRRRARAVDHSVEDANVAPEHTSILTTSLPGAIREQDALLARLNSERVRSWQEAKSVA
jgi:hypothetical protein